MFLAFFILPKKQRRRRLLTIQGAHIIKNDESQHFDSISFVFILYTMNPE